MNCPRCEHKMKAILNNLDAAWFCEKCVYRIDAYESEAELWRRVANKAVRFKKDEGTEGKNDGTSID